MAGKRPSGKHPSGKRPKSKPTPATAETYYRSEIPGRVAFGYLSAIGGALIGLILTGLVSLLPPETFCSANSNSFEEAYCGVGLLIITWFVGTLLGTLIMVALMALAKLTDFWFLAAYAACLIGMLAAEIVWVELFLQWWGFLPFLFFPALAALASARWIEQRPLPQRIGILAAPAAAITAFILVMLQ